MSEEELNSGIGYLTKILGTKLFADIEKKYAGKRITGIERHLIKDGLLDRVLNQRSTELMELSQYLNGLENVEGFERLVRELKTVDEQNFLNFFYQASISYRIAKTFPITAIEKLINGRTPDILFNFEGEKYIAEVTYLSLGQFEKDLQRLIGTLGKSISQDIKKSNYKYVVMIKIKSKTFIKQGNVISKIRNVIKNDTQYCKLEFPDGVVEVIRFSLESDITTHEPSSVTEIFDKGLTIAFTPNAISDDLDQKNTAIYNKCGIFVNTTDVAFQDEYTGIETAIKSKIEQVKGLVPDHKIILFLNSQYRWANLDLERLTNKLQKNIFSHPAQIFEGIVITSRYNYGSQGLHKYEYLCIEGKLGSKIGTLLKKIAEYEQKESFIYKKT